MTQHPENGIAAYRADAARPIRSSLAQRALQVFYLATPVFALLDLALGINLRTTFLDEAPGLRFLYYALAFALGVAAARWPGRAALLGLVESGTNMAWLIVGVAMRYVGALDAALAEEASVAPPFTQPEVLNLVISALVLIVSYVAAQARMTRPSG